MRNNFLVPLFLGTLVLGATSVAFGTVIDFTGGTVTHWDASTGTTNNSAVFQSVDYYTEGGFKLDFIDPVQTTAFTSIVGDYYGAGNDVIHGHWATGVPKYGDLTAIEITKVGGGTFDLNYFILTSNTDTGGAAASGNEQTWIRGWLAGNPTGPAQLLPPDNWGFAGLNPQIFLGSAFDVVDLVQFTVTNTVDCFGMDEFYINEPAPPVIPEPSTLIIWSLLASLGIGLAWWRRRRAA